MRGPRRPTRRPDSGANTSVISAIGSVYRPALSAEYPRISCRYSVFRNRNPPSAANVQTAIALALENGTLRKNLSSSSGSLRLDSYPSNATSATAATANVTMLCADVAAEGASMIEYVSEPSSTITSACPTGSRRRGCGARDSGTNLIVNPNAARPTGTLIQNIDRHPADCTSAPPTTGPSARLIPTVAPHIPIACARSRGR